jgi:hypothetical protein
VTLATPRFYDRPEEQKAPSPATYPNFRNNRSAGMIVSTIKIANSNKVMTGPWIDGRADLDRRLRQEIGPSRSPKDASRGR